MSAANKGYRMIPVHLSKEEFIAQIEDPIERAFYQDKPFTDIDAESECIDIYPHPEIADRINPYWIAFKRIDSPEKIFAWVQHLSKKQWFSKYHLRSLLKTLEKAGFITISHDLLTFHSLHVGHLSCQVWGSEGDLYLWSRMGREGTGHQDPRQCRGYGPDGRPDGGIAEEDIGVLGSHGPSVVETDFAGSELTRVARPTGRTTKNGTI